jgi:ribosome biogenesis GTPase
MRAASSAYLADPPGEGGATPVVVLTKSPTFAGDPECPQGRRSRRVALETAVHVVSAVTGEGLEALAARIAPGRRLRLLGSSASGSRASSTRRWRGQR